MGTRIFARAEILKRVPPLEMNERGDRIMNSAYLMTGSTCYVQPAGDQDDNEKTASTRVVRAELGRIEQLLNNGQFDSVPGIDGLRSELHRVERLQKSFRRENAVAEAES